MKLVIVESPAKAKTINRYLGSDYKVTASVGHVRDLPKSNKNAIDIAGGFIPHYELSTGKDKVVKDLVQQSKKAETIILATDPDREGEAIAWHLAEIIKDKNKKTPPIQRVAFNEITETAVQAAIENPRAIDLDLKEAQEARRVLDRLFGYDLSGLIWKKLRYGLSAGRVQSPALRLLVEKEKEIQAFKPEAYWVLEAKMADPHKEIITFTADHQPTTATEAEKIVKKGQKAKWQITDISQSQMSRNPKAPFTTSTLQQVASNRLGLSPSQTMGLAQKLYEAGHITYMRTDSPNLSHKATVAIEKAVIANYGQENLEKRTFKTKSKNAQEAHEAIRPTNISQSTAGTSPIMKKLYDLIYRRTLASQMKPAQMLKTKITAEADNKEVPPFFARGAVIVNRGWLLADPASAGDDNPLPNLKIKDNLDLKELEAIGKETKPPNRYTEAGLVKELEKRGIGRPSTYAPIIKTLQDRGYTEKEGKTLFPTDTGMVVSDFLVEHFNKYISDDFTANLENQLDEIANGQKTYKEILTDFYEPFSKEVDSKKNLPKISDLGQAPTDLKCPECGSSMIIKLAKTGRFFSCSRFPDCLGALDKDGQPLPPPKKLDRQCPECKKGQLMEKSGRFGQFIACDRYPQCRYIEESPEQANKNKTGVTCPVCHKGEMTEKRGRFGVFYGCSNYPDCKHIIKSKPTGKKCPDCGALMMEGTKTIPERCSNKNCPNNRPDKKTK
ncbi:MAG: type I DNA topoisomerase [Patescibacteria group bacterium]